MATDTLSFDIDIQGGSQIAAQLLGYGGKLEASMQIAMTEIVVILSQAAQGNMHWMNPSGALEDSIATDSRVIDPWHAEVGSSLPYAQRREFGFSGMTDSLGRFYRDDPGEYYLTQTLVDYGQEIEDRIAYAAIQPLHPFGS